MVSKERKRIYNRTMDSNGKTMDLEWDPRNKTSFGQLAIFLEQKWGHTYLSVDEFGVIKELDKLSMEELFQF
jgi:hypothetical protein